MRKINQKNLNQFNVARHTALLQNLARKQKSLATPGLYTEYQSMMWVWHNLWTHKIFDWLDKRQKFGNTLSVNCCLI